MFSWYVAKRSSYKQINNSEDYKSSRKELKMEHEKKKGMSGLAKFGIGCGGCGLIVFIIIIAVAVGGGSKSSNSGTQKSNTSTPAPTSKKFNIDDIYAKIETGMTEDEVKAIVTKDPINCTESEMQGIGTSKYCTYGNVFIDSGSIMVSYMNGKVSSKTKSQY